MEALDINYERFRECFCILEVLTDGKSIEGIDFENDMACFERDYFMLKGYFSSVVAKIATESSDQLPQRLTRTFKLPDIQLPELSGNIVKWFSFYDTFNSLVNINQDLSDVQKFFYLKSTLRGEALQLIDKIPVTGDNYSVALKLITNRYQNTNILTRNHIEALFKIERVKKECPKALTNLIGEFENNLGILEKLGEEVNGWSSLLVYMVTSRLDQSTLREWQRAAEKGRMPTYNELIKFIREYVTELETLYSERCIYSPSGSKVFLQQSTPATACNLKDMCPVCEKGHRLYYCDQFKHLSLPRRTSIVEESGLCANGLCGRHDSASCKYGVCRDCGAKHHTLLHDSKLYSSPSMHRLSFSSQEPAASNVVMQPKTHSVTSRFEQSVPSQVFLATAIVKVLGPRGNSFLARALLDNASQPNLMTERFRRLINARKTMANIEIAGIGGDVATVASHSSVATVASRFNNFRVPLDFVIMEKVTNDLPTWSVDTRDWNVPENVNLADPSFASKGPIDIVIGAQVFFELIRRGHQKIGKDKPLLQNSVFGWLVSGLQYNDTTEQTQLHCHLETYRELEKRVRKFWELENCQVNSTWSLEEKECENSFTATTGRDSTGRYVVSLPKKQELIGQLENSLSIATRRFYCLERRLERDPQLRRQYSDFMSEYIRLGHMKLIDPAINSSNHNYYLPHHALFKPDSTTTKLRVVFDGSCKTTSDYSLNDLLLKGPTVQDEMIVTILRFRSKAVAVTADITKMYRQIWVTESDQSLQRILWRSSPSEPLCTYELTTVTYGTTTAPYLATRCLQQLADDEAKNFPAAVQVVKKGFYVDDLMIGFDSLEEASLAVVETSKMLASAGFPLRKWSSNCPQILKHFPTDHVEQSSVLELDKSAPIKTLGLLWKPKNDILLFKIPEWCVQSKPTKRSILSQACSLFDPLGLVGPAIILAKIFIQTLW
ncbi:uncharacterized protein LOC129717274 [Wyeomyia smithii]|uniref:uncharacterized protein LOC129717274 n=1 Tax=Wyeomyia smithii TaxID=174621 RepID=UPI002467EE88|nr:uncharacterized protein LOC129717274 [Wyeomyia smithii]